MKRPRQRFRALAAGALLAAGAWAQPPADVAEQVFSTRLQILLDAKQWADAARHLQQAQALRPAPAWLAARDAEVQLAHVRIALGRGDVTAALTAARRYLTGDEARSRQLLAVAREQHAAGAAAAATGLAREIVRRTPDFSAAANELAAWEPPAPAEQPRPAARTAPEPRRPVEPKPPASEIDEEAALLARLRAAHGQGNVPGVLGAARLFLTGDRARALKLLEVAREFSARGDRAIAIALTKEVLRRTADFPPARRLLAELEQPPAK